MTGYSAAGDLFSFSSAFYLMNPGTSEFSWWTGDLVPTITPTVSTLGDPSNLEPTGIVADSADIAQPGSLALFSSGLGALAVLRRRTRAR